ncbi:MAG: THUMP domain-containing protein [candidate division Zixibacteria bacterium]
MKFPNTNILKGEMVAKTLSGLEEVLADELSAIGAADVIPMKRSVRFSGDKSILYKANLTCRTATRILKPVKRFQAGSAGELYHNVSQIDWSDYMDVDQTFAIDAVINYSEFSNSMFVAQKTKDAIADWFRKRQEKRPSVDATDPDIRINVHIKKKTATLSLDSSGGPLSHRGYRKEGGKAPLSEVLAAGIIKMSGWDGSSAFVDFMCGSGTFIIEAGLIAKNIAAGLNREYFGFFNWKDLDKNLWDNIKSQAKASILTQLNCKIVGSDIDPAQVSQTMANIKLAGLSKDIKIECKSLERQKPPASKGIVIINPPYGERMPVSEINELYKKIGDALKQRFIGYDAYILTSNLEAAKNIGLRATRRIKLYNGPLECRLLKFEIYKGSKKQKKQGNNRS